MPKHSFLGDLEFMVLLALVRLGDDAYGVPISKELLNPAGREVAVGIFAESRRRWPAFTYAFAGAASITFAWKLVSYLPDTHWYDLPWPWSQLVMELSGWASLACIPLPVLAISLVINRSFRWISL